MSTAVPIAVCLGIIAAATIGNDLAPLSTDLLVLDAEGHSATFAQEDPECKSYQTCGTNRHENTGEAEQGNSFQEHTYCIEPAIHFGGACDVETVPTPELLAATKDQILEWVRQGDLARLNREMGRVETLACNRRDFISSVSLERLGLNLSDFE